MNTYISAFLPLTQSSKQAPSTVTILIPTFEIEKAGTRTLTGIIDNDVTFSLSNRFGSIIPDVTDLQDIFTILGSGNLPSWIGSSSQVWKGTNPISFSFDMYVVNWSPECNTEENLKYLTQLCTVGPAENNSKTDVSSWTVQVHGGYKAAILDDNKDQLLGGLSSIADEKDDKGYTSDAITAQKKGIADNLLSLTANNAEGTVAIQVGSKAKLKNLLVTRCDITPSVVEVYSPAKGVPPRPLYYRVGLSMQTCRAALSTDVPGLFGLSS